MKIVFMGTPQAAVPSLERLIADRHEISAVYTQPDRPSGRGNKIIFSPVKEAALAHGLPVFQPLKIKTDEALEEFRSHNADVAIVVAYGRILPETYLNAFPHGAINVHFSLLPKYRGAAPVNWAIVNGETESGVTTMRMDAGLDTGAVLLQRSVVIGDTETSVELMERLSILGADLLSDTLNDLESIVPQPQDDSQASFAPIMKKDDGRIDWNSPAADIVNRIRGFQPFPTSFTFHNGQKLTLWKASAEMVDTDNAPGEVIAAERDDLLIACGAGTALRVEEVQPEGKKRMATRDFLNGTKLNVGEVLGS
jgi:methionyl-tRNA formyltransferase